jgi:hypothetical protein
MRRGSTRKPKGDEPATRGRNYITPSGLQRLKDEHLFLLTRDRPAVVEVVAWAASNGDRSEMPIISTASGGCGRSTGGFTFSRSELTPQKLWTRKRCLPCAPLQPHWHSARSPRSIPSRLPRPRSVSGLLVSKGDSTVIAVQETDPSNRQRFTIAHEIGHYCLRHQFEPGEHVHVDRGHLITPRNSRSRTGVDPKEIEANQFAACLLMPSKLLSRAIKEFKTDSLRDYHVARLAEEFKVSEQAMTIRLSTLGFL